MSDEIKINVREGTFTSSDGEHELRWKVWEPDCPPRAVLQISHGMCEHIDRYDAFARYLCGRGIVVCGNDHLGHGKSIKDESELGYFGGKGSRDHLAADLDLLRAKMREKYRRLPYIMFGHSMGSFVVRDYIGRANPGRAVSAEEVEYVPVFARNIDGAVICGTAGTNKLINVAIKLSSGLCSVRGRKFRSKMLRNIAFKGYNDKFPDDGENGWLSRDPAVRDAYDADPLCGYCFTVGGYNEMFRMLKSVSGEQWAARVPRSLPVLIIAGAMDPVGAEGAGPREVEQRLIDRELSDVTCKIYDGMRHEIHNEIGREEVMSDLAEWVGRIAEGAAEAATF